MNCNLNTEKNRRNKKVIITKLIGGLGNQMFQYAAGLKLAKKNETELLLDISDFINYTGREFALHNFNISGKILIDSNNINLIDQNTNFFRRIFLNFHSLINGKTSISYIKEPYFHYYPKFLNSPCPCYIDGYWQSEKYFFDIKKEIIEEFSLIKPISELSLKILNKIKEKNSVSIHIRRGDYITNSAANKFHGVCSSNYYYSAINLIKNNVENPYFLIFSDDIKWVKENLKISDEVIYVDHNGFEKSHEDLFLMSRCSHHIIANSSFSWWAAWLSQNPGKIVITPTPWFDYPNYCYQDIIPNDWIKIMK